MSEITAKDWEKLNLRIGQVKSVQKHPTHDHFLLLIDLGPVEQDMQIAADLEGSYKIEELIGKQVAFLLNFEHTLVDGIESQGLLLTTHKDGKPILLVPDMEVPVGVRIHGHNEVDHYFHHTP